MQLALAALLLSAAAEAGLSGQPLQAAPLARNSNPDAQNVVFAGPKEPDDARLACAGLRLPENVYSSPQPTQGWERTGFWETTDGAALATWSQTSFGQHTGVVLTVDTRVLARIETSQLDPKGHEFIEHEGMTTVMLAEDCDGELLFEIHELAAAGAPLEVYDRNKNLLAKGTQGDLKPDVLFWMTTDDKLLCTANHRPVPGGDDVNVFGGIEHFSLEYETGIAALQKEQLYAPQNRWVLLAATQVRALRNADRDDDGQVMPGPWSFWVTTWSVFKWVLLAAFTYTAMLLIYYWVYFPEDLGLATVGRFRKAAGSPDYGSVPAPKPDEAPASRFWQPIWKDLP